MERNKKIGKCLLVLCLVATMVISSLGINNPMSVEAAAVNADFSEEGKVTNGDFESGRNGYSVRDWRKIGMNTNGVINNNNSKYFSLKTVEASGNRVASFEKTASNAACGGMLSDSIKVQAGKTYVFTAQYMVKDISANGQLRENMSPADKNTYYFDGFYLMIVKGGTNAQSANRIAMTGTVNQISSNWKSLTCEFTAPTGIEEIEVCLYSYGAKDVIYNVWLDNISIAPKGDLQNNWIKETCGVFGIPRGDNADFTGNYGVQTANQGRGHEKVLQLSVTRANGTLGGMVAYSSQLPVTAGTEYKLAYTASEFEPVLCGATIDTIDPNALTFVAKAPEKQIAADVKVKAMGILTMPASYLDSNSLEYKKDAALEVDNEHVKDEQVNYTKASEEYRVYQDGWEITPTTEYAARAYVVYEEGGQDYVFYSTKSYKNDKQYTTVVDGVCKKSVFGIAQNIASQISTSMKDEMDFSAIGGEKNIPLIETAGEETEITLLQVYRLVCSNRAALEKWLEGGTTR